MMRHIVAKSYKVVTTVGTSLPAKEHRLGVIIAATAAADITFDGGAAPSFSMAADDIFEVPFGFVGTITASASVTFTEFV